MEKKPPEKSFQTKILKMAVESEQVDIERKSKSITPDQGKCGNGRKGHSQTDQLDVGHDGLLPQTQTRPENPGHEVSD